MQKNRPKAWAVSRALKFTNCEEEEMMNTAQEPETVGTATYSPEDNKLRIYPDSRLDSETYARVKAAGFSWAPKQELFVSPMWTPAREDLLIDLCGEVGDEDTGLVDRAEQRADRFENYSDRRRSEAESARAAVSAIADNIPFGQPILVGHHSEKHARKHAEQIESGMRRAVRMWETSKYWESRAAGAIRAAKYKERPDVRARRIKTIEADKRKQEREKAEVEKLLAFWSRGEISKEEALHVCNNYDRGGVTLNGERYWSAWAALEDGRTTVEEIRSQRLRSLPRHIEHAARWISHYENRLLYERAMLAEAGGTAADKWEIIVGGRVLVRGEWVTVLRVNKAGGVVNSLTTNRRYVPKVGIEDVKDYQPPTEEQAAKVKAATTAAPLCNYPGTIPMVNRWHGTIDPPMQTVEMTKAEWAKIHKDYKGTRDVTATETAGRHRVRLAIRGGKYSPVFITDDKRKDPPKAEAVPAAPGIPEPERVAANRPDYKAPEPTEFDAMKDTLRAGVQIVAAPQLFPTPQEIAQQMAEYLELEPGMNVLEPSAGTGNLITALREVYGGSYVLTAVEINGKLADLLETGMQVDDIHRADFLAWSGGPFDRIIMNPPFENGSDIKHIRHALGMLKDGGVLVALCANGSRQREAFKEEAGQWEDLPAGSFKAQGTGVNVALMVLRK
jgi:protein-L-isoaspartate O-methyltransferase